MTGCQARYMEWAENVDEAFEAWKSGRVTYTDEERAFAIKHEGYTNKNGRDIKAMCFYGGYMAGQKNARSRRQLNEKERS